MSWLIRRSSLSGAGDDISRALGSFSRRLLYEVVQTATSSCKRAVLWCAQVPLRVLHDPFLFWGLADDENDAVLFEKIKKGNYDADDPIWDTISAEAKELVSQLLTIDGKKRLTAEQSMKHPWVIKHAGGYGRG
jgi:serine/threonine protein kinase